MTVDVRDTTSSLQRQLQQQASSAEQARV